MNFHILVLEEKVKSFSLIGHGEKCVVALQFKGNTHPFKNVQTGDMVIGYVAGSVRTFSYLFRVDFDEASQIYFEKIYECEIGAKLSSLPKDIQELVSCEEQIDSFISITKDQYRIIVKAMLLALDDSNVFSLPGVNAEKIDEVQRKTGGENIILYGVPGAGKSWTIKKYYCKDDACMERLVFYPDYTYSDFVGQILPKLYDDGHLSYEFSPGPFTKLLQKAYSTPEKMFYLIIEEINRGNAPAIFGDLFQLLDRDKDGKSEYSITNADIAKYVYHDSDHKVIIPSNMSILCTMNTSDQNVFTLDTAFQRRWNMRLIPNKFDDNDSKEKEFADTHILDTSVSWRTFLTEINKIMLNKNIQTTSSEDKCLGTHFVAKEDLNDARHFSEKVLKYLWDDAFKFTKEDIFDLEKVKSLEELIELFVKLKEDNRFLVFQDNIYKTLVPKKGE